MTKKEENVNEPGAVETVDTAGMIEAFQQQLNQCKLDICALSDSFNKMFAEVAELKKSDQLGTSVIGNVCANIKSHAALLGDLTSRDRVRDSRAYWLNNLKEFAGADPAEDDDAEYTISMKVNDKKAYSAKK